MNNFLNRCIAYLKPASVKSSGAESAVGTTISIPDQPVISDLGNGLAVAYVVNESQGLVYIQHRHLQEAGITQAQLHDIGMTNLGKLCSEQIRVQKHGPIYGIFLDGNFEASLLLLDHLWQRDLAHLVEQGFAIAAPARDILAFCDADSTEGIATLKQMIVRAEAGGDHLISSNLFRIAKK